MWADRRLAAIEASRRLLVLVSDGADGDGDVGGEPVGLSRRPSGGRRCCAHAGHDVEVEALTLDADLSGICRSRSIDLDGTLSLGHYELLADLFG